jgi:hypothetical protein
MATVGARSAPRTAAYAAFAQINLGIGICVIPATSKASTG